jgi:hypothetical protein
MHRFKKITCRNAITLQHVSNSTQGVGVCVCVCGMDKPNVPYTAQRHSFVGSKQEPPQGDVAPRPGKLHIP